MTDKKRMEIRFLDFLKTIGEREATSATDMGGFMLECGPGNKYTIIKINNKSGGQACPFGSMRYSPKEMIELMTFAENAISVFKNNSFL